jgi:hypothetical protein
MHAWLASLEKLHIQGDGHFVAGRCRVGYSGRASLTGAESSRKTRHGRCQDNSWIETTGTKQLDKRDQAGKHEKLQQDRAMESLHTVRQTRVNKVSPPVFLTTFGAGGSSLLVQ